MLIFCLYIILQGSQESLEGVTVPVVNKPFQSMTPTYETESEDEPILYRDSLITLPSAFASPQETMNTDLAPEAIIPPPLPVSPPPTFYIDEPETGDLKTPKKADDVLTSESEERSEEQEKLKVEGIVTIETRDRLGSSQSEESGSSQESVVRSPLKDMTSSTASTYPESELSEFIDTADRKDNTMSQEESATSEFEGTVGEKASNQVKAGESPCLSPEHEATVDEIDGSVKTLVRKNNTL